MKFTSGILASIFIHGFVLVVLTVDLPKVRSEPEAPKAIQVELVAPPKNEEPKQAPKPKPVVKKPAELKKPKPDEQAKVKPPEILRPVYKFAEKDAGTNKPAKSDGVIEDKLTKASPSEKPVAQETKPEPAVSKPLVAELEPTVTAVLRPATPVSRPARKIRSAKLAKPAKTSKKGASRSKNNRPVATTAKGELTRSIRAGKLCVTELRNQLNSAAAPHWPDRLPTYRLPKGNVLQVNRSAFRENARWINLKFRCEIDKAATAVVSFNFEVGTHIPRTQWRRRGLPAS